MGPMGYPAAPIQHTQNPIVTGASVVAVQYAGGVMMGADTLASYGSNARYKGICRFSGVGKGTLIGASGEMSDFQQMQHMLEEIDEDNWMHEDKIELQPSEIYNYV